MASKKHGKGRREAYRTNLDVILPYRKVSTVFNTSSVCLLLTSNPSIHFRAVEA
jgi:hypothetical protein